MFSGIVEATTDLTAYTPKSGAAQVHLKRPNDFNDLHIGDSISVNGVCLTIEAIDESNIQFCLGAETLKVTGWSLDSFGQQPINLERSLRLGDRIHGHLVTGHVDAMGKAVSVLPQGESRFVQVSFPQDVAAFVWPKGSITVNGVSLTINKVEEGKFEVCLIPETLRKTNLGLLVEGDEVTLEVDNLARGLLRSYQLEKGGQ